jgi:prolyl oligopeptidase
MSHNEIPSAIGLTLAMTFSPVGAAGAQRIPYPTTQTVDVVDDYHGIKVPDPYRWLEDVDASDTRAWIDAQNRVTEGFLDQIPQRDTIRARLTELWDYPRYGVPIKKGRRYFFSRNDGLQNQAVLYWQSSLDGQPQVLLDPNALSPDGTVSLATTAWAEDGRLLAYGISRSGSDWQEFRIRDVAAGRDHSDTLQWIKFSSAAWTHDGAGFFYSRYPAPAGDDTLLAVNRDMKLYYHRLGTPQDQDQLILELPDQPDWGIWSEVSHDGRYLLLSVWLGTDRRNRLYYKDLGPDPKRPRLDAPLVRLLDEFDAAYSFAGNQGPIFYVFTDKDAPRKRLIAIDTRRPAPSEWREIIPQGTDILESVQLINEQFVATYLHDAASRLRVFALDGSGVRDIDLPTLGTVAGVVGQPGDPELFFAFTSFLYPTTVFRHDLAGGATRVFRAPAIRFDSAPYETRQVFFRSKDGTRIPMFITARKDARQDGSNPTFLYAYGGFNVSMTPFFSVGNLVWLEMGGTLAVACLRGGGEYGEEWHQAGMFERKQNVFDDFIAAGEYLIAERYTTASQLAIGGGSNGGLLVGAVMTQRPELFGAALPAVGVMDMLRFHKFTIGWAWVTEYGSADSVQHFPFLHRYSPYHNLDPAVYPATLVTTADHDDRVVPGHSFKFAAALQAAQRAAAPVLIRIETKAGHGAGKPTSKIIEEQADRWAFLVGVLKMIPGT